MMPAGRPCHRRRPQPAEATHMARNATAMTLDADVQVAIDTMVVTYRTLPEKALALGFTSTDSHCRAITVRVA